MKKALISPFTLLLALLLVTSLSACGQRGPLYLPDEQAEPPVNGAVTDEEGDEERDESIGA